MLTSLVPITTTANLTIGTARRPRTPKRPPIAALASLRDTMEDTFHRLRIKNGWQSIVSFARPDICRFTKRAAAQPQKA